MKKTIYKLTLVLVGLMFIVGCEYDFIYHPADPIIITDPDNPPDPTLISFSGEIIPIFTQSCATANCHDGTVQPNLTTSQAFNQINSMGIINVSDPSSSELYTIPGSGSHSWKNYKDAQAALVLQWITEGAKNN